MSSINYFVIGYGGGGGGWGVVLSGQRRRKYLGKRPIKPPPLNKTSPVYAYSICVYFNTKLQKKNLRNLLKEVKCVILAISMISITVNFIPITMLSSITIDM